MSVFGAIVEVIRWPVLARAEEAEALVEELREDLQFQTDRAVAAELEAIALKRELDKDRRSQGRN